VGWELKEDFKSLDEFHDPAFMEEAQKQLMEDPERATHVHLKSARLLPIQSEPIPFPDGAR
jgi:hypothetical protein